LYIIHTRYYHYAKYLIFNILHSLSWTQTSLLLFNFYETVWQLLHSQTVGLATNKICM
jgi:hypothetical protein